jgi:hypothetical protein
MISVFSLVCLSCGSKELPSVYTALGIPGNLHSGPLGLVHHLLNVELLPFDSVSTEARELM